MDGWRWRCYTLSMQDSLKMFGTWLGLRIHHPTILWCNVRSIFLFRPHLGRFAPVPWALNFMMMLYTMDRRTRRSLEMTLYPWDCWYFSILVLKFPDSSLHLFLFSMLSVAPNAKAESTSLLFIWFHGWFLYFPQLLLATGEFKWAPHAWNKAIYPKGANNFVRPICWVLCEIMSN